MIQLQISNDENFVELCLTKGEIKVQVFTTETELLNLYNVNSNQVSLSIMQNILEENKLDIIKSFNYSSFVYEWENRDKTLSFKQENNLIIVTNKISGSWNNITPKDIKDKFNFSILDLDKVFKKRKRAEAKVKILLNNIVLPTNFKLF